MATRNALGSIRLSYAQRVRNDPYHVSLQVWSHSYDHPDPSHRNASIVGVYLTQLAPSPNYGSLNLRITDRYGIDETPLWVPTSSQTEMGFEGYTGWDPGNSCGPAISGVVWSSFTGIYDERCLADLACDSRRLQTYLTGPTNLQIVAFNYVAGPATFAFDVALSAPPTAVKLRMGHVGGNGGNPAQRDAVLPDETFVIQVP